jgi:predicted RNA-binding Zn-ribbon protein involved in translation (DUF1610 family)
MKNRCPVCGFTRGEFYWFLQDSLKWDRRDAYATPTFIGGQRVCPVYGEEEVYRAARKQSRGASS